MPFTSTIKKTGSLFQATGVGRTFGTTPEIIAPIFDIPEPIEIGFKSTISRIKRVVTQPFQRDFTKTDFRSSIERVSDVAESFLQTGAEFTGISLFGKALQNVLDLPDVAFKAGIEGVTPKGLIKEIPRGVEKVAENVTGIIQKTLF